MELIEGARYKNMISNIISTLNKDGNGAWYLENETGKCKQCNEKEMAGHLNAIHLIRMSAEEGEFTY